MTSFPLKESQVFPILPNQILEKLSDEFTFSEECIVDDGHRAVRFCTSWGTKSEEMEKLCEALERHTASMK